MSTDPSQAITLVDQETRPWPFGTAHSTGTECSPLLASILATETLETVAASRESGFQAVEDYIRDGGYRMNSEDRILDNITFWVYPAGLSGPYHEAEDGSIKQHGLLVTVEQGAKVVDVVMAVKRDFVEEGTAHVHVPAL